LSVSTEGLSKVKSGAFKALLHESDFYKYSSIFRVLHTVGAN